MAWFEVFNCIVVCGIGLGCFIAGYACGGDDAERDRSDIKSSGCRISDKELWDKWNTFKGEK